MWSVLIFLQKQLKYRIFQHKGVSCRTGNRLTCPPNSNIRQHALDSNHPIKLENFKLVNKSNKYEIKIVESILIHKLGPNLNDRGSSFPLFISTVNKLEGIQFHFLFNYSFNICHNNNF